MNIDLINDFNKISDKLDVLNQILFMMGKEPRPICRLTEKGEPYYRVNNQKKGENYERRCLNWLNRQNDGFTYYLWKDLPHDIRFYEGRCFGQMDIGIDILGFNSGKFIAVQCKYRTKTYKASDVHHFERIANTMFKGLSCKKVFISNRKRDLQKFYKKHKLDIEYDIEFITINPEMVYETVKEEIEPIYKLRYYQQEAIDAWDGGDAVYDMACGSGKSLIQWEICKKIVKSGKNAICLFPTLILLEKFKRLTDNEYIYSTYASASKLKDLEGIIIVDEGHHSIADGLSMFLENKTKILFTGTYKEEMGEITYRYSSDQAISDGFIADIRPIIVYFDNDFCIRKINALIYQEKECINKN